MKNMNKAGKALSTGVILLLVAVAVFAYATDLGGIKTFLTPDEEVEVPVGRCPSSGLTEVTINAQEALASSATDAEVTYYIYDNSVLIKEGSTTAGTVSFDIECGANKRYTMLVINETVLRGFYPETVTVDATGATDTHNFKLYEYGAVGLSSIVSSADPTGGTNISGGAGKNCGFTLTFANNESASGFKDPLIICRANSTAISDISMSGVTEVSAKKPIREITNIRSTAGHQYYTFEYPGMLKSTDSAVKVSGQVLFSASATFTDQATNNVTCVIVDQTEYQVAEYKTLSLAEGFLVAAEDETLTDVGAVDSNHATLMYGEDGYC